MQIHRNARVTRITGSIVEWTAGEESITAPAAMVVYADGTTAAAPLAGELRNAGISCDVVGDA